MYIYIYIERERERERESERERERERGRKIIQIVWINNETPGISSIEEQPRSIRVVRAAIEAIEASQVNGCS